MRETLQLLAQKRMFFAHQSVGANILDGLRALAQEEGVGLRIASLGEATEGPALVHAFGGTNGRPESKITFFREALDRMRPLPQVALMKLCYVDVVPDTDVALFFSHYHETAMTIRKRHPRLTLVPITVPLTVHPSGLKARLYHPVPVLERRGERLHVGDASLLFYYRNRLAGYGLRAERS